MMVPVKVSVQNVPSDEILDVYHFFLAPPPEEDDDDVFVQKYHLLCSI